MAVGVEARGPLLDWAVLTQWSCGPDDLSISRHPITQWYRVFHFSFMETYRMTALVEKLDRALYPTYARNWDDQLFRERILQHLTPTTVILDLGAGAGIVQQMNFRGHAARVCGVDLDPRVVDNPFQPKAQW